jgi:hypothetical protein
MFEVQTHILLNTVQSSEFAAMFEVQTHIIPTTMQSSEFAVRTDLRRLPQS